VPANLLIANPLPVSTLALTLAGCAARPPLERLLADVEASVEARDTDGVVKLLAPDFKGQDGIVRAAVPGDAPLLLRLRVPGRLVLGPDAGRHAPPHPPRRSLRAAEGHRGPGRTPPGALGIRFELGLRSTGERLEITSARWERIDLAE